MINDIANEKLGFDPTCEACIKAEQENDVCCDEHFEEYKTKMRESLAGHIIEQNQKKTKVGIKYDAGTNSEPIQKFVEIMASPIEVDPATAKASAVIISNNNNPMSPTAITTDATAYSQAKRLQAQIEKRKKIAAMFANVTPEMVIGATAMRAFADPSDAFDEDGNFDYKRAVETGAIYLIKKFKKWVDKNGEDCFEIDFYSQESAQDRLGNYLGIEKAPVQSNDESSLKTGIETIAAKIANIAGRTEITSEDRLLALEKVVTWAKESKARYSDTIIEKVVKEIRDKN